MEYDYQSPWFTEALEAEDKLVINQLNSKEIADICIVGKAPALAQLLFILLIFCFFALICIS